MSLREDFMRKVRVKEYEESEKYEASLQESATEFRNFTKQNAEYVSPYTLECNYKFNVFKHVLNECVCNLYLESLLIDDVDKYKKSLRESASIEFYDTIKDCKNSNEIFTLFENASPYIQEAMILSEAVSNAKKEKDKQDEKYPQNIILDINDQKLIDDFEKLNGKKDVGDAIQKRVIDVYKAEEKDGQKRKEKAQAVIDDLAKAKGTLNESVVSSGLNTFSATPNSVFHAIYMNRSKMVLNESASITDSQESVIAETVCIYTLLECIHGLGIKTFSFNDREKLKAKLHLA